MPSKESKAQEASQQRANLEQRQALNHAYAALEGQKSVQSFSAFTFEEALDNQIELIEGSGSKLRPNLLDRVKRVEEEVVKAVEVLKKIPPEQFVQADGEKDVNTNPAGEAEA